MSNTSIKYKPLYDLLLVKEALDNKDKLSNKQLEYFTALSNVDIVVLTGGRYSGKSYEVGDWDVEATLQYDYQTLYTRFTNQSMGDSVMLEIQEKIERNGLEDCFSTTVNKVKSLCGDGFISFKGIKTGSGGQTANLKSLKGFNVMVVEEAEEIPDFETFQKVYYSIRSTEKQNISILLLNPATSDHWIYQKFFEEREVEGGSNIIKDNVLYIHTSYLDVDPAHHTDNIIKSYERMKKTHPQDYYHIVEGGWITDFEGAMYKKSEVHRFSMDQLNLSNVESTFMVIDPADRGTDNLSAPICKLIGDQIYVVDWYFSSENQDITIPEIGFITQSQGVEHLAIETNGVGLGYYESLQNHIGCQTYPFSQQANKHSRIFQNSGFVRLFFHFRDDYEKGSMYDKAMRELFAYSKDDKENKKNTNFNDDAPDSLAAAWIIAKDLFNDDNRWI